MTDANADLSTANVVIEDNVPHWMDEIFVLKCLQSHLPDKKITVHGFEVKAATAKGDNYASYIYRVSVKFSDNEHNVSVDYVKYINMKTKIMHYIRVP